jgi:hypothetical protein
MLSSDTSRMLLNAEDLCALGKREGQLVGAIDVFG